MRDELDARPQLAVDRVAVVVIVVPVRVDDVAHRLRRQLPQLRRHHARGRGHQPGVDDDDVGVVDDEERVPLNRVVERVGPDEPVHAGRELRNVVRRHRCGGIRRRRSGGASKRLSQETQHQGDELCLHGSVDESRRWIV